jgi:sugar lactone lactonase YvrE
MLAAVPAGASAQLPQTIALPNGFQPEGIASGDGSELFVGSIPTGAIWAGDARTGQGEVRVQPRTGRSAIGIEVDERDRIFAAGGETGDAFVYDAESGRSLRAYRLAPARADTFVNDLAITDDGAYFTDSRIQRLYFVPFGRRGRLGRQRDVERIRLRGDITYGPGNNANGIVATPNGRVLIIVQSNTGKIFRVNARTGNTVEIDFAGATFPNGDGLLLRGRRLHVVQNRLNKIAVIDLARDLETGTLRGEITDADFDVPTTLTRSAGALWAVNARFGTQPGPNTTYNVVRVG